MGKSNFGCQNACVVSKAVHDANHNRDHNFKPNRKPNGAAVHGRLHPTEGGMFRVVPLYDLLQEQFGETFNLLRSCDKSTVHMDGETGNDTGVLVLPSVERNSGPLYIAKIVHEK